MYIHIYIHIYMFMCVDVYIHIHIHIYINTPTRTLHLALVEDVCAPHALDVRSWVVADHIEVLGAWPVRGRAVVAQPLLKEPEGGLGRLAPLTEGARHELVVHLLGHAQRAKTSLVECAQGNLEGTLKGSPYKQLYEDMRVYIYKSINYIYIYTYIAESCRGRVRKS